VLPTYCHADAEVKKGLIIKGRKVNVAAIGCGSKGAGDIAACRDENVVALCDVDWGYVGQPNDWGPNPLERFPQREAVQ
jgi:hypothetical protein